MSAVSDLSPALDIRTQAFVQESFQLLTFCYLQQKFFKNVRNATHFF